MEVKAQHKYLRISPTKVRLVANAIKRMPAEKAEGVLQYMQKGAAKPMLKLLKSAMANAGNNYGLKEDNLYIKLIQVDSGPTLKRFRPRAQGKAFSILKRTSHVTLVLEERR